MGELQVCNWAINGCVRRSVFVFFSYSLIETSKMAFKSEEVVVEGVWDMMAATAVRPREERRLRVRQGCLMEIVWLRPHLHCLSSSLVDRPPLPIQFTFSKPSLVVSALTDKKGPCS